MLEMKRKTPLGQFNLIKPHISYIAYYILTYIHIASRVESANWPECARCNARGRGGDKKHPTSFYLYTHLSLSRSLAQLGRNNTSSRGVALVCSRGPLAQTRADLKARWSGVT